MGNLQTNDTAKLLVLVCVAWISTTQAATSKHRHVVKRSQVQESSVTESPPPRRDIEDDPVKKWRIPLDGKGFEICTKENRYYEDYLGDYLKSLELSCEQTDSVPTDLPKTDQEGQVPASEVQRRIQSVGARGCPPKSPSISLECIRASLMDKGAVTNKTSYDYPQCRQGDRTTEHAPGHEPVPPCVSEGLAKYIYAEVNQAIECINSKDPIPVDIIFGTLFQESRFLPNIRGIEHYNLEQLKARNRRRRDSLMKFCLAGTGGANCVISHGTGIGQLTKPAIDDFLLKPHAMKHWDQVKDSPECKKLVEGRPDILFDDSPKSRRPSHLSTCQITSIQSNPVRNLIIGMIQFKATRQDVRNMLADDGIPYAQESQLVDKLTQVYYNGGGGKGIPAYKSFAKRFKAATADKKAKMMKLSIMKAFQRTYTLDTLQDKLFYAYIDYYNTDSAQKDASENSTPNDEERLLNEILQEVLVDWYQNGEIEMSGENPAVQQSKFTMPITREELQNTIRKKILSLKKISLPLEPAPEIPAAAAVGNTQAAYIADKEMITKFNAELPKKKEVAQKLLTLVNDNTRIPKASFEYPDRIGISLDTLSARKTGCAFFTRQ